MLAHFEDFNLAFEQLEVFKRKLLLFDDFDCIILSRLFVDSCLH